MALRRWAIIVALVVVALSGCARSHSAASAESGWTLPPSPPKMPSGDSELEAIHKAWVSFDQRRVIFAINAKRPPCGRDYTWRLVEDDQSVTIRLRRWDTPTAPVPLACPADYISRYVHVRLREPIGDRQVYDAISEKPVRLIQCERADVYSSVLPTGCRP